jgi:hypothetical protein
LLGPDKTVVSDYTIRRNLIHNEILQNNSILTYFNINCSCSIIKRDKMPHRKMVAPRRKKNIPFPISHNSYPAAETSII